MLRLGLLSVFVLFLVAVRDSHAQVASPPIVPGVVVGGMPNRGSAEPSGTVTGHVYAADTQRPARFAEVAVLKEMPPGTSRGMTIPGPVYQQVGRGRTALDGSFAVDVPAGDYFVVGTAPGYVSPQMISMANGKPIRAAAVHVEANRSSDAQVSMERGAVVTGRVLYEDGSPVSGVSVQLRLSDATSRLPAGMVGRSFSVGNTGYTLTDDRGVYRCVGIAPGKYLVAATVQTETTSRTTGGRPAFGSFGANLNVFAPGTMHKTDARVVEIKGGETVDGVDLQVALAGLHAIKGVLEAKADSHPLNSGFVSVSDAADSSFARVAQVNADGTYFLEYLPAGNYTLTLNGTDRPLDDSGRRRGQDNTKRYQPATKTVVVGDHDVSVEAVLLDDAKTE